MRWDELNLTGAPKNGQMLAYTRKRVVFEPYEDLESASAELRDKELLEVHLFDAEKEYRAITTRSSRFSNGFIQTVADFSVTDADVYKEDILLEKGYGKITVLNHISYDDNGLASVDNYRLRMGGK